MDKIDTGMQMLLLITKFYEINIEETDIRDLLGKDTPLEIKDIVKVARETGLKSKTAEMTYNGLVEMHMPAIAQNKNGEFCIILQIQKEKILLLLSSETEPVILSKEEFTKIWNGHIILFTKKYWKKDDIKFGVKWFLNEILKYKPQWTQILLAAFMIQILGIFTPMIIQVVIDKVLVHNSQNTLNVLSFGLFLIIIFETTLAISKNAVFYETVSKIDAVLSSKLFKHLFSLPFSYFEERRTGDTIARVREIETVRQFLTGAPLNTIIDSLFLIIYITVLFLYSKTLTVTLLISLPLFIALSLIITPILKERIEERYNTGSQIQSYLVESVSGIQTVKSLSLENRMQNKWEDIQSEYIKTGFKTSILGRNSGEIAGLIQKTWDILILYYGAKLVITNKMTVGELIAFRMLSSKVTGPILRLVQIAQDIKQTEVSIERLCDIFKAQSERNGKQSSVKIEPFKGEIEFKNVTFRYRNDTAPILKNVTFKINQGETIGIIGKSGSGKSTIAKLIQKLYKIENGKITIDENDISLIDPMKIRKQIGMVLQESFLFYGTIRENISIQKNGATMEEIIKAAKTAGAHDFITKLPAGYDTMLSENGTGLSGGQKQRIAIARALLSDPKILIFDEATSALDYESESIIKQNLDRIRQGRTMLIIAHRLSTIQNSDRIISVENGEITEFDTPENLIKQKGLYYHLSKQQNIQINE